MSFSRLISAMDQTVVSTFRRHDPTTDLPLTVTLHYKSGVNLTVDCVVGNPVMEEDYVPGSIAATEGTGVVILFIHLADPMPVTLVPTKGDTASYGGSDYDLLRDAVDREGGMKLYLRRRSQRWDQ